MCLGMNPDILMPGERCASTSNRNFEAAKARVARTHLVSPPMAAGGGHRRPLRRRPAVGRGLRLARAEANTEAS